MKFESKYAIGQFVWLNTDEEQLKRIVVSITFSSMGAQYELANGNFFSPHYDYEITDEPDPMMKM